MKTLIIDNYDSFTYNLYQYIGELRGNPEVVRNNQITIAEILKGKYSHIVISPGPGSPCDPLYFGVCMEVIKQLGKEIPILGVCLGHQGIVAAFGGEVVSAPTIKHGKQSQIHLREKSNLFKKVTGPFPGMRYHSLVGDKKTFPSILKITAESSDDRSIMALEHREYPIYGIQFHPESIGTENGKIILSNFLKVKG